MWARQVRQAWQARQGKVGQILAIRLEFFWGGLFRARWDGRDGSDKMRELSLWRNHRMGMARCGTTAGSAGVWSLLTG